MVGIPILELDSPVFVFDSPDKAHLTRDSPKYRLVPFCPAHVRSFAGDVDVVASQFT